MTLIDRRNFHLFQPLLYQVATGALSSGEIRLRLRYVLNRQKNNEYRLGKSRYRHPARGELLLRDGAAAWYTIP